MGDSATAVERRDPAAVTSSSGLAVVENDRSNVWIAAALFLAAFITFVTGLGEQHLWSKDEARPGIVAKEMVATGRWAVPHIGGRVYVEKPPLFMWAVALLSPRGVTEWTLRMPSVLAAAITVAMTYVIGAHVATRAVGLMAAAVLASSFTFFQWARTGRMEALLALWITLSCWSLVRWLDDRRPADAAALGLWIGLGMLTKGPTALLPLVVAALALVLPGRSRAGAARAAGLVALVTAGVILAWLGTAAAVAPDFAKYVHGLGPRLAHELQERPPRHNAYVIEVLAAGFFPWSLALPFVAGLLVRNRRHVGRTLAVPLLWAAVLLIVFVAFVRPREAYFLPILPALSILVGWAWVAASRRARWALATPLLACLAGGVAAGIVSAVFGAAVRVHSTRVPITVGVAVVAATLAAVALVAAVALLVEQRPMASGLAVALATTALFLVFEMRLHTPGVNTETPVPAAAARLAAHLPPSAEVAYLDRKRVTAIVFYMPHRSIELRAPSDVRRLAGRDVYVVVPEEWMGSIQDALARPLVPLERAEFDGTAYVVAGLR